MKVDKILFTGAALGAASLLFPLLALKTSRIDDGHTLGWFGTGAPVPLYVILTALVLLFYIALSGRVGNIRDGIAAGLILVILFLLLFSIGPLGTRLIDNTMPSGRISPASGFWLMAASLAVCIHSLVAEKKSGSFPMIFLLLLSALFLVFLLSGSLNRLSVIMEFGVKRERLISEIANHLRLTAAAVSLSLLIGIPLGLLSAWRERSEKPVFLILNTAQTIPSLALFGILIAPLSWLSFRFPALRHMGILGIGNAPALIALTLYALLPVARNTLIGLKSVDSGALAAGQGMGMSRRQLFFSVELPLALPVVLTGVRISAVQAVGNTAVAALIGAGGLGVFIFQGLGQGATDLILLGVIPLIVLAVLLDRLLLMISGRLISPGLCYERISND